MKPANAFTAVLQAEKEILTIEYNSNIFGSQIPEGNDGNDAVAKYFMKLNGSIDDDIRLGYTLWGAHRDDLVIKINGLNIKEFGSQGQKKQPHWL